MCVRAHSGQGRDVSARVEQVRTSISPLSGQGPYLLSLGSIQIAGQSQSPRGSFARTSTFPYAIVTEFMVLMRADWTGWIVEPSPLLDLTEHAVYTVP